MHVDQTLISKVQDIQLRTASMVANLGIKLVIVDYLQLLGSSQRGASRVEATSEISRELKVMAKAMDIPVIAVSQLSRAVESRPNKRPLLSDLRDSGTIEQDADGVFFLFRKSYYNDAMRHNPPALDKVEVNMAKHRHGSPGMVELAWRPNIVRFENLY